MVAFKDRYQLTRDINIRYAKGNFMLLVHTTSRFEGVNTTFSQTQAIIDGMGVSGVSIEDTNVILFLKRGWEYVLNAQPGISQRTEMDLTGLLRLKTLCFRVIFGQGGVVSI